MSVIKLGFCTKLTSEFDSRMKQLTGLETQLNATLNALTLSISTATWSPHYMINKFKRDIGENLNLIVPPLAQFDELITLANTCLFTKNDSFLSKPSALARAVLTPVKTNASSFLDTIGSGIPSELSAAKLVNQLKSQAKLSKLNLMVPQATQALNCMSAICGTDITSRLTSLQTFLNKYNFTGTGDLSIESLLASQGIGQAQVDAIRRVEEQISGVMDRIEDAFDEGIDRIKDLWPDSDEEEDDEEEVELD